MARVRSPNYPAMSLPDAIQRVKGVHEKQQTTPEPKEVVVKHMGYGSVNGSALKSLSALIKYGLLDDTGDGDYQVSQRALDILYPESEATKNEALLNAAHDPKLFSEIFDRWDSARPSEESLQSYLVREGFNIKSVDAVARIFYATYDLVIEITDSYDSLESPNETAEDDMPKMNEGISHPNAGAPVGMVVENLDSILNSTKPIFDFESVTVHTKIDNQADLEELIKRLEQVKSMLPNGSTKH